MTISNDGDNPFEILAMSTDDGRLLFYNTGIYQFDGTPEAGISGIPSCKALGQIGGALLDLRGRIKDFELLRLPDSQLLIIVTGGSDGAIRFWICREAAFQEQPLQNHRPSIGAANQGTVNGNGTTIPDSLSTLVDTPQLGALLATYEAGNRILCLSAFIMSQTNPDPEHQ